MMGAQVRRRLVEAARERGPSAPLTCALFSVARGYRSSVAAKDASVVETME